MSAHILHLSPSLYLTHTLSLFLTRPLSHTLSPSLSRFLSSFSVTCFWGLTCVPPVIPRSRPSRPTHPGLTTSMRPSLDRHLSRRTAQPLTVGMSVGMLPAPTRCHLPRTHPLPYAPSPSRPTSATPKSASTSPACPSPSPSRRSRYNSTLGCLTTGLRCDETNRFASRFPMPRRATSSPQPSDPSSSSREPSGRTSKDMDAEWTIGGRWDRTEVSPAGGPARMPEAPIRPVSP